MWGRGLRTTRSARISSHAYGALVVREGQWQVCPVCRAVYVAWQCSGIECCCAPDSVIQPIQQGAIRRWDRVPHSLQWFLCCQGSVSAGVGFVELWARKPCDSGEAALADFPWGLCQGCGKQSLVRDSHVRRWGTRLGKISISCEIWQNEKQIFVQQASQMQRRVQSGLYWTWLRHGRPDLVTLLEASKILVRSHSLFLVRLVATQGL